MPFTDRLAGPRGDLWESEKTRHHGGRGSVPLLASKPKGWGGSPPGHGVKKKLVLAPTTPEEKMCGANTLFNPLCPYRPMEVAGIPCVFFSERGGVMQ